MNVLHFELLIEFSFTAKRRRDKGNIDLSLNYLFWFLADIYRLVFLFLKAVSSLGLGRCECCASLWSSSATRCKWKDCCVTIAASAVNGAYLRSFPEVHCEVGDGSVLLSADRLLQDAAVLVVVDERIHRVAGRLVERETKLRARD